MVAAFNAAPFIAGSIRSALEQTMGSLEVIVVDDRSTDTTAAIVETLAMHDPRVRLDRLEQNGGPARARNRGLDLARGEHVAILDGDDLWAPDRLARLLAVMEDTHADLVADDLVVFDDAGGTPPRLLVDLSAPMELKLDRYLADTVQYGAGTPFGYLKPVFRLDRLRALADRYDERLGIGEDDDLIIRLLRGGARYLLVPGAGYAYRKHGGSISHRLSVDHAAAMTAGSRRLLEGARDAAETAGLRRRHAGFLRAEAFARVVDALKRSRWREAASVVASRPGVLALFRIPITDRIARAMPQRGTPDPRAAAALATILAGRAEA